MFSSSLYIIVLPYDNIYTTIIFDKNKLYPSLLCIMSFVQIYFYENRKRFAEFTFISWSPTG